ncbi:MAG: hypothetical protein EVJ48_01610 [Candidatus Acidulodesulfobacterium acidiphilum]|uniref:Uncharacterized protein n=1 Tax=Candidatus Acidulodesulfobacterium acidiphilum TaxID=2597224 RepID=A0A520XGA3_9DELT|nr:MAG: hypothetical protein EVJ48_01610 [Candidatus Acidulodesulfobacterium acidiphilum]
MLKKIKKLLNIKDVPKIEVIKTYEDVNLFLDGYKHYFSKTSFGNGAYWFFTFCNDRSRERKIRKVWHKYIVIEEIATGLIDEKVEPNIRAYIWVNRDDINKALLLQKERNEYEERKLQRQRELENQIKKNGL